jgi:hypothetical protein
MRFQEALLPLLTLAPLTSLGCAPPLRPADAAPTVIHIDRDMRGGDPPVLPLARFVPIDVPPNASFGIEPGGGARSIAAGVRVVSLPGGGVVTAAERLPGAHWDVIALPERLGGGFLFRIDDKSLWRAEKWLGPARPLVASSGTPITRVVPGLDRVYLLMKGWRAIDGATGEPRPLGPWPASPTITAYAAADGWRAIAIVDLRGAVATSDAGATWKTLALPFEPRDVSVKGDLFEVSGTEPGRGEASYEVRPDGQVTRVSEGLRVAAEAPEVTGGESSGPLGAHPLAAAVDDGWPLGDGTALVARDGALSRVRLDDGAVVETAPGAFPLRPSRCHPIPLGAPGAFGFVCGEPRGATVLYAFHATPSHGAMTEDRRFDVPRAVLASGNGAIVVRGSCDHAAGDGDPGAHLYCVRTIDGAWNEIRVEGAIGEERVAALADGRFAIVSPPKGFPDTGRLTIVAKGRATSVPLAFSERAPDPVAAKVLAVGVWLDGVEERRPGVLGGWIEASGTMLGFELGLDGKVLLGAVVRGEHSLPMVSGRYGLGWSAVHTGFETTDGGMTWSLVPVPDPLRPPRAIASRACGPVGCSAAGWLRIGWGAGEKELERPPRPPAPWLPRSFLSLGLECESTEAAAAHAKAGAPDLLGSPPPLALSADTRFATFDTLDGSASRLYAWGPKSSEWGDAAKWMVRWVWPFGGASDVRSTAVSPAPSLLVDSIRAGSGPFFPVGWSIALGDDPSHALLLASRRGLHAEATAFELDADHAPVEIRRAAGEPMGDIETAVRAGGRWYLASAPPPFAAKGGRLETIVWQVDGSTARELARIPRSPSPEGRVGLGRLALRADGGAIGYVVDGQPPPDRAEATRWVAPIDLDSGVVGELEPLGSIDQGDRSVISTCTSDDVGWTLDLSLDGAFPILVSLPGAGGLGASLHGALGRLRLGRSRTCVERIAATVGPSSDILGQRSLPSAALAPIPVTLGDRRQRHVFRCAVR